MYGWMDIHIHKASRLHSSLPQPPQTFKFAFTALCKTPAHFTFYPKPVTPLPTFTIFHKTFLIISRSARIARQYFCLFYSVKRENSQFCDVWEIFLFVVVVYKSSLFMCFSFLFFFVNVTRFCGCVYFILFKIWFCFFFCF